MSEERWELEVAPTVQEAFEAMLLAGQALAGLRDRVLVGVSAIAIALPRRAFPGPQDADVAFGMMRAWQAAAT